MSVATLSSSQERPPGGLLEAHVESFLGHLRGARYAERTLRKKRPVARSFARWIGRKRVAIEDVNESHLSAFVARSPRKRKARVRFELAILRLFLRYLRLQAVVPTPPIQSSPVDDLHRRYVHFLRNERGLAENSIGVYSPYIHDFITGVMARCGSVSRARLDAQRVQDFILDRVRDRSNEWSRLLTTALRSFLRFLYGRGETVIDLSSAVPTFRKWRQAALPDLLSPEEVARILSATDLSTPRGRRDHAILLLLARLALRAGEIVFLDLDDIHWRSGEIVVRGKGRMIDRLPLLEDVGEALARYLRHDRGSSSSRRVFLRMLAPRIGLTGPAAVGHVVRAALVRAGIRRSSRGAAHLFRHSLGSRMIRHGASLAEISQVLRHRSQNTTEIYAKVDFEALREVARPWPGMTGGVR